MPAPTLRDDPRKSIPAPAGYVRFLLKRFGTRPDLLAALLHGTDIDEGRLQQPGAEVTLFTFVTLSGNLTRLVGEAWPLDAMAAWSNAMQGALEVAVRSAPTVGDSVDVVRRFGFVRAPFLGIEVRRDPRRVHLAFRHVVDMEAATSRSLGLTVALGVSGLLAPLLEAGAADMEVSFPWPQPPYAARLRDALATQVAFGARAFQLSMPASQCPQPSPFSDAGLHAAAIAELENTARRIHASNRLLLALHDLLARKRKGRLNEDEAAQALGMSRRTLVRRLSASGTSFREMLDADLKARARVMLDHGTLSRPAMAEALGFDDPTSFSRACRRWFGQG